MISQEDKGILKFDGIKHPSLMSVTSKPSHPREVEPSSSQASASQRLSVTFAIAEDEHADTVSGSPPRKVLSCSNVPPFGLRSESVDMKRISVGTRRVSSVKSRNSKSIDCEEEGNEQDYSASACAIMQRRSSTRRPSKRKRRPSSPFGTDTETTLRRRSSAYTISSGDTAISVEETGNQEQIFEKLKLHKEVLGGVKQQPWPLRRKIRLVRQAKSYVRRHEGALQERLAQTRSTKDAIARISLFTTKKWQYFRRELVNLQTWLIPWELRIKEIESHFGSAVASYFIFLRWLFWINLVMSATLTAFVAIPEMLIADATLAGERKIMLTEEQIKSKHLLTLWQFEGVLKYSPFFYGWYTNQDSESGYRLPLAYFVTNLVVYTYSFVAILRKMATNSRLSKLTEKEDECAFSWKLFTGWDFMIGNPETAHNRMASIVLGFKEALLEEAEKEKDERNWKIISMRIFVNICVMSLLALSAYAVIQVVGRSTNEFRPTTWWRQNEITIVMSLITYLFPIFFEILGFLESYHPRKQLRIQLARIMVLNLLNLYSLIFALFGKINSMKQDLGGLKPINKTCTYRAVKCHENITKSQQLATLASLSLILLSNGTHAHVKREIAQPTLLPELQNLYLNPIIDNETLQDIYNAEDYPPLDYSYYDDYDGSGSNTSEKSTVLDEESYTNSTQDLSSWTTSSENPLSSSSSSASSIDHRTIAYTETGDATYSSTIDDESSRTPGKDSTTSSETSSSQTKFTDTSELTTLSFETDTVSQTKSSFGTIGTSTIDQTISTSFTTKSDEQVIPLDEKKYFVQCVEQSCTTTTPEDSAILLKRTDPKTWKKLRQLCWETMFGQELAKLTVMDLILTIISTLSMDFFRAVFVRFMNNCWCWDLEKQFPQYGDFKIAENILHLVNNQGMVWMGMFFSPGLTALNLLKLGILMYLRSWAVLTCNVPHEVIFRASRSNNFYFALLLTMLFLCVLPVGYAIVWVEPSWHCGPFSGYQKIYHLATKKFMDSLPKPIQKCIDYIASPGIVIPLIVLMTLIIYYMASLTGSLREANNDLKIQLRHERTEERRKLFQIVEKRQEVGDTAFTRWKKILPTLPTNLATNILPSENSDVAIAMEISVEPEGSASKPSVTSDMAELADVEQDSLPSEHIMFQRMSDVRRRNSCFSNVRTTNILGESWESQSSDCAVIPEIRINEAENRAANESLPNPHETVAKSFETSQAK